MRFATQASRRFVFFRAVLFLFAVIAIFPGAARHPRTTETLATQRSATAEVRTKGSPEALRLNTLGVAYMNQGKSADAQKYFEQALAAAPDFAEAKMNLGIALLAQQKLEQARAALEQAAAALPNDPYAWYNLGLVYKDSNEPEKAVTAFQHVEKIRPDEPDAFYFEGFLLSQLQKYDDAIVAFQKALAIAPYHASAQFGLARAYQRKGETEAAREGMQHFQKLTAELLGTPFGAGYGDQGKFSLAEFVHGGGTSAPPQISVLYASAPISKLLPDGAATAIGASRGACFFDYDGDGKADLFFVGGGEGKSHLLRNLGDGKFTDATEKTGLAGVAAGFGCAAGDFDNDGWTDLAVCEAAGIRLFHNDGGSKFVDVTEKVGIRREKGCVAASFVDYDHDGDLDLYLSMASETAAEKPKNKLWRNNGDSTFTDVSEESGLGIDATGAGVVATDFNNDRAIDFVLAGGPARAAIYLNPREGKFTRLPAVDFAKANLPPAVGVVAFDFDKDGWMDLAFTHSGAPGISMWRNLQGKKLERVALPDLQWKQGWGISWIDFDNDGWLDLIAVGEGPNGGEIRLLRNQGDSGWSDVTKNAQLDGVKLSQPRALAVADLNGRGGPDVVVTQEEGAPIVLENVGANRNNWARLDFKALNDNKSAIGTKVEVYAGALYQKWEIVGASGYLSQNPTSLLVGLGPQKVIDAVRLLWPTGVPQDEVNLVAQKTQTIGELDRRGSSCPILFSWNGKKYVFIADMIGPGVVGHWIAPGERDVPDPDEYLKVPAKSVQPKNGRLSFRFMEPMEETVYLDQARLVAVDHPSSIEVNPNERFVSAPPFPEFRVIATRNARLPKGAWDDHGHDVLPALAKRDRKYVTGFEDLPFTGFAKLHWIELDLGEWNPQQPLRLLLDGYTDYFTATSMFAADQAGIKVIAPYVETQDAQGKWVRGVEDMGFPAGLARTMVTDLTGKIPRGTRRIRVVTNLKIYWDRIRIDQTPPLTGIRVNEVPLAAAELAFLGYPQEVRLHPASDTVYSYSRRSPTGPYARAAGNYTRYGDVKDLLGARDDKFAVFSSGEGVKLEFDPAGLPELPENWVRDYFFYADGFEKDLDFYAAHAFTVEPLPKHGLIAYPYPESNAYPLDAGHLAYELEYNTRSRSDRMPGNLRYSYPAQK
ncbi:MAG TPA: FG-GAP-like repeat-containing protein [Candidatus Acidoferrum sp.]|nr:FG-GAP-like repeat-containing protein [Candidatus Acidoferrum sp.]